MADFRETMEGKLEDGTAKNWWQQNWANEFAQMPEEVKQSVAAAFAASAAGSVKLSTTRSFPHNWTFSQGDNVVHWQSSYNPF